VGGSKGQCLSLNQQGSGRRRPRRRCAAYFQLTAPWSGAPLCVLGDRYSEYEIRSPRRRCAAYFQRTAPWFRAPLCVLGDRYSEYEMRSPPPSLRRLLPAYRPLVPSTIMCARRQVQRVRDEKFPAVAAPPTSSVPPPGPEHHYSCLETGTASTRREVLRRRYAAFFQRTAPWFRAPLCVLGDRYSGYEMRSSPPSIPLRNLQSADQY